MAPPRGRIYDRRGRPLAVNVPTYRVYLVREQAPDPRRTLERLARLITLPEHRVAEVERQARARRPFVPVPVRDDLSWEELARVAVHLPELPGIVLDSGLLRDYPHGPVLAHILGYVGAPTVEDLQRDPDPLLQLPDVRIGRAGIEATYDRRLRGRAGRLEVEVNAVGREIRELGGEEGRPGEDLELSVDLELQRYCFDRIAGERSAAAVVLDVVSGAVLAAASVPAFDPRLFTLGLDAETWRRLARDPLHPLVDKCIRGQYPPGSTFKMITALAGLAAGAIGAHTEFFCPGHLELGNNRFHCWKSGGHGRIGLVQAIAQSCDVYFYEVARRVGIDAIAAMARRFGLGEPLGVDLPGERPGLVPTREWKQRRFGRPWQKGETVIAGIGQGFVLATPLQLAVMTARLCNGGRAVRPWFVRDRHPEAADPGGSAWPSLDIPRSHLEVVLRGMEEVVNGPQGTARSARLPGPVRLAGKTGTSQVRRITRKERLAGLTTEDLPWEERDHALFVCYAPADAPRYAVAVVVEHGGSGGRVAAPIARDIVQRTLELDPAGSGALARAGLREAG
ncbi:Peptidoglycan D,D-transpeptidase MrdA [bacterium HR39]|nr:Peptidoglycan D,D-transpeptidase MrdA [bacterium HR39]